jgi:hypothetical protein
MGQPSMMHGFLADFAMSDIVNQDRHLCKTVDELTTARLPASCFGQPPNFYEQSQSGKIIATIIEGKGYGYKSLVLVGVYHHCGGDPSH